jgi:hypothetical protein
MIDRERQTVTTKQRLRAELRRGDPGTDDTLAPPEAEAIRRAMLAAAAAEAAAAEAAAAGRWRRAWPAGTVLAAAAATVAAAVLCLMAILIGRQLPRPGTGGTPRPLRAPPPSAAATLASRTDAAAAVRRPLDAGAGPAPIATPGRLARGRGHGPGHGAAGRMASGAIPRLGLERSVPPGIAGAAPGTPVAAEVTEIEAFARTAEGPRSGAVAGQASGAEPAAPASAETPRQVQFSTKGGTRVIWVMRPESSR